MNKLIQWKRVEGNTDNRSQLALYLTVDGFNWYHYTNPQFKHLKQPEDHTAGASKGMTTARYCLKQGFKYLDKDGNIVN